MPRTVHGLQGEGVLLHVEGEHVPAVVLPVARGFPELAVVHGGGQHLREVTAVVLLLQGNALEAHRTGEGRPRSQAKPRREPVSDTQGGLVSVDDERALSFRRGTSSIVKKD